MCITLNFMLRNLWQFPYSWIFLNYCILHRTCFSLQKIINNNLKKSLLLLLLNKSKLSYFIGYRCLNCSNHNLSSIFLGYLSDSCIPLQFPLVMNLQELQWTQCMTIRARRTQGGIRWEGRGEQRMSELEGGREGGLLYFDFVQC